MSTSGFELSTSRFSVRHLDQKASETSIREKKFKEFFIEIANSFDGHIFKWSMILLLNLSKLNDYSLDLHCYQNLKTKYFNQNLFSIAI